MFPMTQKGPNVTPKLYTYGLTVYLRGLPRGSTPYIYIYIYIYSSGQRFYTTSTPGYTSRACWQAILSQSWGSDLTLTGPFRQRGPWETRVGEYRQWHASEGTRCVSIGKWRPRPLCSSFASHENMKAKFPEGPWPCREAWNQFLGLPRVYPGHIKMPSPFSGISRSLAYVYFAHHMSKGSTPGVYAVYIYIGGITSFPGVYAKAYAL